MIVSKARHAYLFIAIFGFIILLMVTIPFYVDDAGKPEADFVPEKFINVAALNLMGCAIVMLLVVLRKRKVIIDNNTIYVQLYFGFKTVKFDASEIRSMVWGNSATSGRSIKSGVDVSGKFAEIQFKDGSLLLIGEYDYKNAEELRAWFYSYCIAHGIIDVDSPEEMKEKREKRRKAARNFFKPNQ